MRSTERFGANRESSRRQIDRPIDLLQLGIEKSSIVKTDRVSWMIRSRQTESQHQLFLSHQHRLLILLRCRQYDCVQIQKPGKKIGIRISLHQRVSLNVLQTHLILSRVFSSFNIPARASNPSAYSSSCPKTCSMIFNAAAAADRASLN